MREYRINIYRKMKFKLAVKLFQNNFEDGKSEHKYCAYNHSTVVFFIDLL